MQYSFMSFSCPELTLDEMIDVAKNVGYDGLEPRLQSEHAHGIRLDMSADARAAVHDKMTNAALPLCCLATSCRFANPETCDENIEETLRAIDLAGDVGAPRIRVFGGAFPEAVEREAAIDAVAAALGKLAERAAERGVVVCMETHDDWCNPEHLVAVLKRVDHPNIAANWDIMHPVRTGNASIDESFQALKPWIQHVHVHDGQTTDGKLTLVPIGQGQIDHRRALELLIGMDYDGYISGEWIKWESYLTHLPRELGTLKGYEADIQG